MADLQVLEETYGDQGFHVLGFYSDDFNQAGDPDSCTDTYMVTFPQFAIDHVVVDPVQPVWQWLLAQPNPEGFALAPDWNFHKYLISRDGQLVHHYLRATEPEEPQVAADIEAELAK